MLVVGTQFYDGSPDAMRRQQQCLRALTSLRRVMPVNVQWVDEVFERPGTETLAVLRQDASTIVGRPAPRKPILPELFDALAGAAAARNAEYFGFANADVLVAQAAVDLVLRERRQAYAFSRMDFDPVTGRDLGLVLDGVDFFVFRVDWWRRERRRFRPYILGEWFYDCVFAAMIVCHGDGLLLNRDAEIRHEAHVHLQTSTPLTRYNGYLVARDAGYFSLWAQYRAALAEARARGASEAEERALQRRIFVWRPTLGARIRQTGRSVKAWVSYHRGQ